MTTNGLLLLCLLESGLNCFCFHLILLPDITGPSYHNLLSFQDVILWIKVNKRQIHRGGSNPRQARQYTSTALLVLASMLTHTLCVLPHFSRSVTWSLKSSLPLTCALCRITECSLTGTVAKMNYIFYQIWLQVYNIDLACAELKKVFAFWHDKIRGQWMVSQCKLLE